MLERIGGPDRDRTDDLFHAMEARSQLRHRPTSAGEQLLYCLRSRPFRQTAFPLQSNATQLFTSPMPRHRLAFRRVTHITCSELPIRNNEIEEHILAICM